MQWEDKKIEDNNRSLLFKARLKKILIKEIVSFSLVELCLGFLSY